MQSEFVVWRVAALPLALLIFITYTSPVVALGTESRSSDPQHTPSDHADAVPKLVAAASTQLAGRIEELIDVHGVRQAALRRAEVPGTATHMDVQHALVRLEKGLDVSSNLILKWSKSHQLSSLQGEGKYNRNDEEVARLQTMLNKFQEMSQRKRAPLQAKIAEMERIEEGLAIDVQQVVSAKKVKELEAKRQKLQKEQVKTPVVKQPVGQKQDKLKAAAKTTHQVASPKKSLPSPVLSAAAAGTLSAAAQPVTVRAASESPPKQDATEIKEDFAEYLSESTAQPPKRHLRKLKKTQDENVNLNVPLGPVKVSAKLADFLTVEPVAAKVVDSQSDYLKRLAQMHSLEKDASAYLSDDGDVPEPGHSNHKSMSTLLKVATRLGQTRLDPPKVVGKSTPPKAVVTSPPKKLHKSMATLLKVASRMTKASKARRLLSAKLKKIRIPIHKTKEPEPKVAKVTAKAAATAPQKLATLASKPVTPAQKKVPQPKAEQAAAKAPQPKAADVTKVAAKAPDPKLVKVAVKPAVTAPKKVVKLVSKPVAPTQKKATQVVARAPQPKAAEVTKVAAKVPEPKLVKVVAKPVATAPTKVAKSASKPVAPTRKKAAQVVAEAPQPKAAKVIKVVAKAHEPQVAKVTAKPVALTPAKVVKLASEAVAPSPEKVVAKVPQPKVAKVAKVVAKAPESKLAKVAPKPVAIVPKDVQMAGMPVAPVPENALNSSDILRIMRIEYSSTSNGATTSIAAPAHHTTTHDLQSAKAPKPEKATKVVHKMPKAKDAKVAEKPVATVPNKVVKLASKPVAPAPKQAAEKVVAKALQPKAAEVTKVAAKKSEPKVAKVAENSAAAAPEKVAKKLAKPQLSKQQPQHSLSMSKVLRGWLDGGAGQSKAVQEDATVHTQVHMSRTLHEFLTGNTAPVTPAPGSFEQLGADYLAM